MTDQAKKTDAWMPLWIGDYLADTMSLNTAQNGAYLLLLIAYWRNKGPLPDDDGDLATTVRATQAEWKKLKPKMLRFFEVVDGHLVHGRANKELEKAGLFAKKAHARAVKAAAARWGDKDASSMLGASDKHRSSTAPGELDPCPTPSPSPSPSCTPPFVAEEVEPPHSAPGGDFPIGTLAGRVCKLMKAEGVADVNPSNQTLRTLVLAGATDGEFQEAARAAVKAKAGFAYALTIVANERKRAAALAQQVLHGAMPAAAFAQKPGRRTPAPENFQPADYVGGML